MKIAYQNLFCFRYVFYNQISHGVFVANLLILLDTECSDQAVGEGRRVF